MALELTGEGETEEDEELVDVVKVKLKRAKGKGKQRDFGQQSGRESYLQITVVYKLTNFFQRRLFNLATMMTLSLSLIPTHSTTSMSTPGLRMLMTGLVTSTL